jgi:two-component system NarL family sensor kinase
VIAVTAASFGAFAVVFAVVRALAGDGPAALVAGLAVMVLAVPVRVRVRDRVDRALYGHRDVSTAVARMSHELDSVGDPSDALPGLAHAVAEAVGASGVLLDPEPRLGLVAVHVGGSPAQPALERALRHRGRALGRLVVGARTPGEAYAPRDLALIEMLSSQVALALDAVELAIQLQISRGEIVTAREEERRRLRRDLHDGIGPTLAAMSLRLEVLRDHVGEPAGEIVDTLSREVQEAIADIRRVVYALRPPVLDEYGLLPALTEQATRLTTSGSAVEVHGPDPMPPLPAAVEVAAYRIALEAVTNAARHAGARSCQVRLTLNGGLRIEVADDGSGLPADLVPGVGLGSMRERAAELGGTWAIESSPGGGTVVRALLPLERT